MKEKTICMVGFGNVAKAFARLIQRKENELKEKYDVAFRVTAIATGRHGRALDPQGIDLNRALELSAAGKKLDELSKTSSPDSIEDFIVQSRADFLLENSPVNYENGEPALTHIRCALEHDMHAVSANKGPVVHAYHELKKLAGQHQRKYLFESAVMDGAPVFSVFREALPAANLVAFEGILNSCTNLLIELMEQGKSFDEAVAYAQSIGIAETDPSGDIDGWDAAIKVAAIVTVLMDTPYKPQQVARQGIRGITQAEIRQAQKDGSRWKLVCRGEKIGGRIVSKVAPERVTPQSPLYSVSGTSSFVLFKTDVLPGLGLLESNPSPDTTAYGLLADVLNILKTE
jgi:homoserine dehydrogenase